MKCKCLFPDVALIFAEPSDLPKDVWDKRVALIVNKFYKGHQIKKWEKPIGFHENYMIHLMADIASAVL